VFQVHDLFHGSWVGLSTLQRESNMKITIEFNTDNAAFEDSLSLEIRKVLVQAMDLTVGIATSNSCFDTYKLRDTNGNTVGTVTKEEE
jgi:hypothetical protein